METCGFIMSRVGEFESFLMRCSYCTIDMEIDKWQEFVLHFRNTHGLKPEDNSICLEIDQIAVDKDCIEENVMSAPIEEPEVDSEYNTLAEADMSRPCSSLSETSLSENDTVETASELRAQLEDDEEQRSISYSPTYKFNPSFFRRDPRTLIFIESYKSQPCLWNPGYSNYKDPTACKAAYQQLITELDSKISVMFSEHSLKAAINKLHIQYNTVKKRVLNGSQKPSSVAFNHYTSCAFLKACQDQMHAFKNSIIQLNFSKRNQFTTDFIHLYANFPQLYDNKHKDFSSIAARKQAYETMAAETVVPHSGGINCDDIYLAIQCLRQWYYKSTKHAIKTSNESEQFYLKACAFLPPKMFKQKLICELCQQETSSDHVLQAHMCKVHNIGELPFKCSTCERRFVGRAELSTHMQRFHIGKTHKCNYCDRTFAVNSDLRLHIRTHTGNNILCEQCGKAFRLRSQLKLHVTAIHTKIRAFKCTMCPKDFLKKVDLSDHIKSHLNIRDKICTTCGKGFTSCHSLIRHRQIHSEIKKFVCKLCEARFSQFVGLNSHMKRTHNIVRNNVQKSTETVVPDI
ncbi:zinc finger protein 41 [Drosophila virilis]|uniref:Uncharacterized protein n=1 Tax=Drosophila virilis TaxID=7244 RepID=B4LLC9_DROVI|nr:zinc finger protein 484 [Drosophila virilis]EDW61881.1 uncharacterized protein Dvir_GJ20071 [Drosophila virilis]